MDNDYDSIYETVKGVIQTPSLLYEWKTNTLLGSYGNEYDIEKFYDLLNIDGVQMREAK